MTEKQKIFAYHEHGWHAPSECFRMEQDRIDPGAKTNFTVPFGKICEQPLKTKQNERSTFRRVKSTLVICAAFSDIRWSVARRSYLINICVLRS